VERAAEKLLQSFGMHDGKCLFTTSGSEAVEFGAQIIRGITGKRYLLTFEDSFLGSHGSVCARSPEEWHLFNWLECTEYQDDIESSPAFQKIPFEDIGGFVFEPGSSSGLVRFPPAKVVEAVVKKIIENSGLLQVNEVTTGAGRTGKMYGYMHYDVEPDIISLGKGIGNGYPVSSVAMKKSIAEHMSLSGIGLSQSHQNDPLGASAVLAVLTEFEDKNIVDRAAKSGEYFLSKLADLKERSQYIEEVRGRGLMISVTLKNLSDEEVYSIFVKLLESGYIVVKRPGLNVFRIDPPLVVEHDLIDSFVTCLDDILRSKDF